MSHLRITAQRTATPDASKQPGRANLYLDARPVRCPHCSGGTYAYGTALQQLAQASGRMPPITATHCILCRRLLAECPCAPVRRGDEPCLDGGPL